MPVLLINYIKLFKILWVKEIKMNLTDEDIKTIAKEINDLRLNNKKK